MKIARIEGVRKVVLDKRLSLTFVSQPGMALSNRLQHLAFELTITFKLFGIPPEFPDPGMLFFTDLLQITHTEAFEHAGMGIGLNQFDFSIEIIQKSGFGFFAPIVKLTGLGDQCLFTQTQESKR